RVPRAVAELPTPGPRWGQSTVEGHFSPQKWGGCGSKVIVSDALWRTFSRRFDSATARRTHWIPGFTAFRPPQRTGTDGRKVWVFVIAAMAGHGQTGTHADGSDGPVRPGAE